jgi:hypothetical protein
MTAEATSPDSTPALRRLQDRYVGHHQELAAAGVNVTLEHSPPGWSKASIAANFDCDPRLASLIIWDTGETELDLADLHAGAHIPQHHDISSPAEVDQLLDQILTWISPGEP